MNEVTRLCLLCIILFSKSCAADLGPSSVVTEQGHKKQSFDKKYQACVWKKKLCGPNSYGIRVAYSSEEQKQHILPEMERPIAMAVDFWSRAIQSRPLDFDVSVPVTHRLRNECGTIFDKTNQTHVHAHFSLLLCFRVKELPSNKEDSVLGTAEVLLWDSVDELPRIASIELSGTHMNDIRDKQDSYTLNQCDWANVITHEIGHALGFLDASRYDIKRGLGSHFHCGARVAEQWRLMSKCPNSFPILDDSGSHWPENDCMSVELMTPRINFIHTDGHGKRNEHLPVSRLTLAALEDIGYKVNYDCADSDADTLRGFTCDCHWHEQSRMVCRPNREKKLRREMRRRRRKAAQFPGLIRKRAIKLFSQLGKRFRRLHAIVVKGYVLKPWWWRRKYRSFKKGIKKWFSFWLSKYRLEDGHGR